MVARKYQAATNTYSEIPGATITQVTIDGHTVTKVTYNVTDGGALDEDGSANGMIIDPSGPAINIKNVKAPITGGGLAESFLLYTVTGGVVLVALASILRTSKRSK